MHAINKGCNGRGHGPLLRKFPRENTLADS
jgi:hypothetical protein